jgi:hypothetical protein
MRFLFGNLASTILSVKFDIVLNAVQKEGKQKEKQKQKQKTKK